MTRYAEVAVGELFEADSGKPKYVRTYMEAHPGSFPVYSASLVSPFGHVDDFDYEGHFLTWVMNGYGGRVQEISGQFAASRDRGVLRPKSETVVPDLTYMRFALEPQLMAAAVGRRVDGRANEYTKIYPETALNVQVSIPITTRGEFDFDRMAQIGNKLRAIEQRQAEVQRARDGLARAVVMLNPGEGTVEVRLNDSSTFELSIGRRVLRSEHAVDGVPVYSANPLRPFGYVEKSELTGFDRPSLLWGIDGVFDWNMIPAGVAFATTDHCGRVQIKDSRLDPEYVWAYLKFTRTRHGFDRVFRASLRNVKSLLTVHVPADSDGEPLLATQRELAREFKTREGAQGEALVALDDVLRARLTVEL